MTILDIKKINKSLSGKKILNDVSFSVNSGEIYGFLGPNGAGKTTIMKCIMGFIKPESGEIRIFGKPWLNIESRKYIGFMPENTYLYKYLSGEEFLKFNGGFFGMKKKDLENKVKYLLEIVGLKNDSKKHLNEYSKGMLQRIGIAQSIINKPKLLFLDEPMSGLDPIGRKMVKDLLSELRSKGTTIFFNTHILADVESICDRISIINMGKIIVEGKKISSINGSLENFFMEKVKKN